MLSDIRTNPRKYLFEPGHEFAEQLLVYQYLPQNANVLEFGGRSGEVSRAIQLVVNDTNKHIVIEPDHNYASKLKEMGFNTFSGVVALNETFYDGYVTDHGCEGRKKKFDVDKCISIPTITFDELQIQYDIVIDTLIIDCEGAFVQILKDFPNILDNINCLIIEYDMPPDICANLINLFKSKGFHSVATIKGWALKDGLLGNINTHDNIGHEVWKK
jgi:FkbM family methyltransferase